MRGSFFVVEGIDGSGKGTVCKQLSQELEKRGRTVLLTAEPSNSVYGKRLRAMLSHDSDPKANAEDYLRLFVADRKEHLKYEILPAIERGELVVCDRYKHSTIAFQSAQGIPAKRIIQLHEGLLSPDLTIILDLPPETAIARMSAREKKEKFEKLEFMRTLRENYLALPKLLSGEKIAVVDASAPVERVVEKVLGLCLAELKA